MQCEALKHAPLTSSELGIVKGEESFFASQARNCKQTVIQVPLSPFWIKRILPIKIKINSVHKSPKI